MAVVDGRRGIFEGVAGDDEEASRKRSGGS